jgi:hypothetical protein
MARGNNRFILAQSLLLRFMRAPIDNECFTGKRFD